MNGNEDTGADEADGALAVGSAVSIEQLQRLVRLLDRSDVSELELKRAGDGLRLVLRKAKASDDFGAIAGTQIGAPASLIPDVEPAGTQTEAKSMIVAPLVGIFHPWAKPRGKALVAVGDRIKVGQIVATIESLNVINEVEAVVAGRVTEILVQNGQPVEYGQPLMSIEQDCGGA